VSSPNIIKQVKELLNLFLSNVSDFNTKTEHIFLLTVNFFLVLRMKMQMVEHFKSIGGPIMNYMIILLM
jgi:hypothetical protein